MVKLKRWTYIIRCGKYSIRQVVEGEIRICIYFNEGHFLFGRGSTHNSMELLSEWAAAVDNFQMWNFGQARLPLHSQSYSSRAILPNPGFNANHLAKWLSKTQIQTPDNRTCNYFTVTLFIFLFVSWLFYSTCLKSLLFLFSIFCIVSLKNLCRVCNAPRPDRPQYPNNAEWRKSKIVNGWMDESWSQLIFKRKQDTCGVQQALLFCII